MDKEQIFQYMQSKRVRVRTEVIAIDDNDMVLAYCGHPNGLPELPGGGLDKGEDIRECARREVMEESGWDCKNFEEIPVIKKGFYVVKPEPNSWYEQRGFDAELSVPFLAQAISFCPTDKYQSEGDGQRFKLIPFDELYALTKEAIEKPDLHEKFRIVGELRLEAMDEIRKRKLTGRYSMSPHELLSLENASYMKW